MYFVQPSFCIFECCVIIVSKSVITIITNYVFQNKEVTQDAAFDFKVYYVGLFLDWRILI